MLLFKSWLNVVWLHLLQPRQVPRLHSPHRRRRRNSL